MYKVQEGRGRLSARTAPGGSRAARSSSSRRSAQRRGLLVEHFTVCPLTRVPREQECLHHIVTYKKPGHNVHQYINDKFKKKTTLTRVPAATPFTPAGAVPAEGLTPDVRAVSGSQGLREAALLLY